MIRAVRSRRRKPRRKRNKPPRGRALRGVPDISTLRNKHAGETIVIYGNSGSLNSTELGPLKQLTSIGVNRILRLLHPTYFYAANDSVLHDEHERMKAALGSVTMILFPGIICTKNKKFIPLDFPHISTGPISHHQEPSRTRGMICMGNGGGNSSYQAAQIAYRMGAKRIILAGNDLMHPRTSQSHFYGPPSCKQWLGSAVSKVDDWSKMKAAYASNGVEVLSCSPWKSPLRDALGYIAPASL